VSALRIEPLVVAAAVATLMPATAAGWGTGEHQQIGRQAYTQACAALVAAAAAMKSPAPGIGTRLDIACGRNLTTTADVYGDATAIAGDFLGDPSEFMSQSGAWRFKSNKSYYLLALENSQHFNPMSTQSWADYHGKAIDEALAGARADGGLETVRRFQLALQESAFADHFLQDSFAAGHMGFNRTASSAAASKSFHDAWNDRGRIVSDRNGDRWVTFGDGWLNRPENDGGRRHVQDAATMSVRNVLRAFVFGERSPDEELALWRALPFTIQAPETNVGVIELFTRKDELDERQLVPLLKTIRPVRKDTVFAARLWSAATFSQAADGVTAAVGGFELAVPRVPAQTWLGAGGTLREPGGSHSLVVDTGLLFPLGLSFSGLISHQLNTTVSWLFLNGVSTIIHAEYQMNIELGDVLISLHGGLAEFVPDPRTGWYAAFGLGYTFSAAGGGTL
jgi:hypothetical protein